MVVVVSFCVRSTPLREFSEVVCNPFDDTDRTSIVFNYVNCSNMFIVIFDGSIVHAYKALLWMAQAKAQSPEQLSLKCQNTPPCNYRRISVLFLCR